MSDFRYGDVLWVDFNPASGHEQVKRRPAVVVSNDGYNRYNNLIMVVPVTSSSHYPLHVDVGAIPVEDGGADIHGWAEVEQLKSLDLEARNATKVGELEDDRLEEVTELVLGCLMQPTMVIRQIA